MGYEAVNFNANLFAMPQLYSGVDSSCIVPVCPNSIFSFQFPQTAYYNPINFSGFNIENSVNLSKTNYYDFNYFNLYANRQFNLYNYVNPNCFSYNTQIPYLSNNIFSGKVSGLPQIDTSSVKTKYAARDGLGSAIASKAASFIGKVNSDAEGNRLFSGGKKQAWCQDFVSWNLGAVTDKLPKIMTTTSSPIAFRDKAISLGCYQKVPASDRINWAKNNIHKGDVIVKSGKGQSGLHVAIALDVKDDGTILAVSGNSGNAVKQSKYNINKGDIYGVVDIEKAASFA